MAGREDYDLFFREEYSRVLRATQMILQDTSAAEDATQEAFIRLHRHWSKVAKYDKPEAWVRRVAIRIAVREKRKENLKTVLLPDHEPSYLDVTYNPDLMKGIALLPPMQRAAVVLFYMEDRPLVELAEILDCSSATAGVHLHKARKRLARMLGSTPDEEGVAEGVA